MRAKRIVLALCGAAALAATSFATPADAQYFFGGRHYCFYPAGWHGPGFYWCGYAFRRGFGWGGPVGWHGWHGGRGFGFGHGGRFGGSRFGGGHFGGGHFGGGHFGHGGHFGGGHFGGHMGGGHMGGGHMGGGHMGGHGGHR